MPGTNDPPEAAPRLPVGSIPLNETEWTGDHTEIKHSIGVDPDVRVMIGRGGNVWSENPDGSWTNHNAVADHTASGRPKGRKGKHREKPRASSRARRKRGD